MPKQNAAQYPGPAAPATHTHSGSLVAGAPKYYGCCPEVSAAQILSSVSAASALRSIPSAHPLPGLKDCMYVSLRSRGNSS